MASDPIPEPLTNQEVNAEQEASLPTSSGRGPELVARAAPPTPAERELPRAPRPQEWKDAVEQKLENVKQTAARAKETASQAAQEAKEQAIGALAQAKDRVAGAYRESRDKTTDAIRQASSRAGHFVNEHPLQVIAGVAAIAFVAGILLRVWRSSRDA